MDSLRIIIVDDHEVVRLGLRTLLNKQPNFTVIDEAPTAHAAIQKILTQQPDIVVMDISVPDGINACREIAHKAPKVKIIILSSHVEDEALFEALAAGATGYVLKQIGSDALIHAIETAGFGDTLLDPMLAHVFTRLREVARQDEVAAFAELSEQELRVLALLAEGKTNRQIADQLFLGGGTVRNYVSSLLSKLHLSNRVEATAYAVQHNLKDYMQAE
jgi:two-component system response regulator DevR